MISVKVTDKDIIDTAGFDIETQHLLLRTLAAINQVKALVNIKRLCRWISVVDWCCRTASQDSYIKPHVFGKTNGILSCFFFELFFNFLHKYQVNSFISTFHNR